VQLCLSRVDLDEKTIRQLAHPSDEVAIDLLKRKPMLL